MPFVKIRMKKKTLNISKTKIQVKIKNGILCFEILDNQYFNVRVKSANLGLQLNKRDFII